MIFKLLPLFILVYIFTTNSKNVPSKMSGSFYILLNPARKFVDQLLELMKHVEMPLRPLNVAGLFKTFFKFLF